jgi:hypothetical protein
MLAYPHDTKLDNTWSYVNDMTCWNNLDINEFQSKGNYDKMEFVTCNIPYLFAPRLKA